MKTPAPMRTRYRNTPGAEAHTTNGSIRNFLCERRRTPLPQPWLNGGKNKGRGCYAPTPAESLLTP
jgi:hypothetical protein